MDICSLPPSKIDTAEVFDYAVEIAGRCIIDNTLFWLVRCPLEDFSMKLSGNKDQQNQSLSMYIGAKVVIKCSQPDQVNLMCTIGQDVHRLTFATDVIALTWRQVGSKPREDVQISTFP